MSRNPAIGWLILALLVLGTFAWLMWGGPGEEAGGTPNDPSAPAHPPSGRTPSDGG